MDPKPAATPTSCSTEVASAGGGQVNVRKTLKKMTGTPVDKSATNQHAEVDKSTNKHAGSRKSVGKGENAGAGTTRKRKRKKTSGSAATSAAPNHPSVLEATACTKKQEQVEEARARETVYLTPKTESVATATQVEETRDTASNTGPSAGDDAVAGGIPRARRPWEWSAKDCDAVLVDVLSRARPEVEFSEGELIDEDVSAVNRPEVNLGRDSGDRKRLVGSGGEASNGKVNADQDERKAREVNAALNRNNPRIRYKTNRLVDSAPQPRISGGKVRASSTTSRKSADDEQEARNLSALLNRNNPRRGLKPTCDGVRSEGSDILEDDRRAAGGEIRFEVGNSGSGSPAAVHATCTLNGGGGLHLCAGKGVALGKGSAVEVLWDDRTWYRCTLSSISAEGTHGVLEFLPYRRRNHSREFSSQLELGEWIRAGKLALPGTHLKWD